MAGWSVLGALSGLQHDASVGELTLSVPPAGAALPFLAGGGWGHVVANGEEVRVECHGGRIAIRTLGIRGASGSDESDGARGRGGTDSPDGIGPDGKGPDADFADAVTVDGATVPAERSGTGSVTRWIFDREAVLEPGQAVTIRRRLLP